MLEDFSKTTIKVYGTKAQQTKALKLVKRSKRVVSWYDGKYITIASCNSDTGYPSLENEALIIKLELGLCVEFKEC